MNKSKGKIQNYRFFLYVLMEELGVVKGLITYGSPLNRFNCCLEIDVISGCFRPSSLGFRLS